MSEELKPCPFCGSSAKPTMNFDGTADYSWCRCSNPDCPAELDYEFMIDEIWQTRPIEDELRKRISELETAQRWIPVSERLPEEGEQVWATDGCHIWVPEFYQKWGGECLSFGAIDDLVTHWLPCSWLPELPEVTE